MLLIENTKHICKLYWIRVSAKCSESMNNIQISTDSQALLLPKLIFSSINLQEKIRKAWTSYFFEYFVVMDLGNFVIGWELLSYLTKITYLWSCICLPLIIMLLLCLFSVVGWTLPRAEGHTFWAVLQCQWWGSDRAGKRLPQTAEDLHARKQTGRCSRSFYIPA